MILTCFLEWLTAIMQGLIAIATIALAYIAWRSFLREAPQKTTPPSTEESETKEVEEKESLIVVNAHRVNSGEKLVFPEKGDPDSDFYFINNDDEKKAFQTILTLCSERIPKKFDLHPLSPEIQVISPMYRGLVGVDSLNAELQKRLNPSQDGIKLGSREIRIQDKVMQIKNNYEKEIFNGDIGSVVGVDKSVLSTRITFPFQKKRPC